MENSKDQNDLSRLDRLQNKLYSPKAKFEVRQRRNLHKKDYGVDRGWKDSSSSNGSENNLPLPKTGMSFFAKILIVAFVFFLASVGYAYFIFTGGFSQGSSDNVDIEILGPVSVASSDPLTLDVIIQNNNPIAIDTVDLSIEYPDGTKNYENLGEALPRITETLGVIEASSVLKETYTAALFGEEGTKKKVVVGLKYRLADSTAVFEKTKTFEVLLQSSPLLVTVNTDKEVTAGQELEFDIEVTSNSTKVLRNVLVVAEYPFGFRAVSADPRPVAGTSVWRFDEFKPNESQTISLIGTVEAQDGEERVFKFNTGIADESNTDELGVIFTTVIESIDITKPFFAVDMTFDRESGDQFIKNGGSHIQSEIVYSNSLEDPIRDVRIEVEFDGDTLERDSVSVTDGFFRSTENTIVWNQSTFEPFEEILPKSNGAISYAFKIKDLEQNGAILENPELKFNIRLSGIRVGENDVEEELSTEVFKNIKFVTEAEVVGTTFYGVGQINNTGPIPPVAEQETTYTIQWDLLNTSNDIGNAKVTGRLPEYVDWGGEISPAGAPITYDDVRKTVTWNVGSLPARTGYDRPRKQVAFKVKFLPSITQIGDTPLLITNVNLTGTDTFTGTEITDSSEPITIQAEDINSLDITGWKVSR